MRSRTETRHLTRPFLLPFRHASQTVLKSSVNQTYVSTPTAKAIRCVRSLPDAFLPSSNQTFPQQLPGKHPWSDGAPPQQVEPTGWAFVPCTCGGAGTDILDSRDVLPQVLQVRSSEFLPMPTRNSFTAPHSLHVYS